jgi:mannose-6-phosphate isomerase-like protein (cupin superfamily)
MKATFTVEPFLFTGAGVHIRRGGNASLLQGNAIKARLRALPEGHLLGVFQVASPDELHSDIWEMHPAGDEVLLMLSGELGLEYADGSCRGISALGAGRGVVMPRGVWHRLLLREPGLSMVLSPSQGTKLSRHPGQA